LTAGLSKEGKHLGRYSKEGTSWQNTEKVSNLF